MGPWWLNSHAETQGLGQRFCIELINLFFKGQDSGTIKHALFLEEKQAVQEILQQTITNATGYSSFLL